MQIKKMPYSVHPWRLLTADGGEVYAPQSFDHPDIGMTSITMPVSGATKQECIDKALALLEVLMRSQPRDMLRRARNLLSHPSHWAKENSESRHKLAEEIAALLG